MEVGKEWNNPTWTSLLRAVQTQYRSGGWLGSASDMEATVNVIVATFFYYILLTSSLFNLNRPEGKLLTSQQLWYTRHSKMSVFTQVLSTSHSQPEWTPRMTAESFDTGVNADGAQMH